MLDKYKLFEKIGYEPHPKQTLFHDSTARFKIPCCGRRFGKTQMAAREITAALLDTERAGGWYWLVGPTYGQGEKEFRVILRDLSRLGIDGTKKGVRIVNNVDTGKMSVTLPWGTKLEVKSAEKKEGLQGEGLAGVVLSEAASHDNQTWEQYIRATLVDPSPATGERGWAIFPSTPKGFNWYYHVFMRGLSQDHANYECWSFPSWDNPIAFPGGRNDEEILDIERTVSQQYFDQEYGANFTTFEGKIYDEFTERDHVKVFDYNPAWRNYWVMDFGFSNPFVCLDVMVDPADNVYVWREYYVQYKSTFEHGRILQARRNPEGFHCDAMFGDPRGADEIATMALVLGAVYGRPVPWKQGIEAVKRHLKLQPDGKPKLFIHPRCVNLIREMHSLRAKELKQTDRNFKEGQHDYDDHACDALRYFFSEYYILGAGGSLIDVYSQSDRMDVETYFRYNYQTLRDDAVGF